VARKRSASAALPLVAGLGCALSACHAHDFPQYPPGHREYAYVTNGGSGTVTVYDVVNLRVDREIAVGQNPVQVAASPTRNEVYVVNSGPASSTGSLAVGSLSVIDASKNTVAATIPLHRRPVAIDIDSDGARAYVANAQSNSISVVDLAARREVAQIGTGEQPVAVRLTPDGRTLVIANQLGNSVTLVEVKTGKVRAIFDGCPGAADIAVLPDSSKTFIACSAGHQVMALSLAGARDAQTDRLEALLDVGRGPVNLAIKPDGGEVFVSNSLSNSISEIDTSKNDVGGAYLIGEGPVRGLVTADNSLLYVANLNSQYVTIYSTEDGRRLPKSIHVGDGPTALALSSTGVLLFVVDTRSADLAVVRTDADSRAMISMVPTGRAPNAIAIKAFSAS
jgi:YVTN family beta-propeller protein